jgi:hypothetical protein
MKWTSSDSVPLREYLIKSGYKLVDYYRSRIPLCDGKTIEEVALQAKFKEGFEFAIRELKDLSSMNEENQDATAGNFTAM